MSVTFTGLTSGYGTGASPATASISPPADTPIYAVIETNTSAGQAAGVVTASGCGLTWVEEKTLTFVSGDFRLTLFRAQGASPTTGAITFTVAGSGQDGAIWGVFYPDGADTSGSNGSGSIVQSVSGSTTGADPNTFSVTLAALEDATNNAVVFCTTGGAFGRTENGSYTELYDFFGTGISLGVQYKVPGTTTPSETLNDSGGYSDQAGIAIEVRAQSAPVTQSAFRFGLDDGSESAHTWAAAENTDTTQPLSQNLLLRVQLDSTGDPPSTTYKLKFQKNGTGGYTDINVGATSEVTPVVETGDCTVSGSNTAQATWAVSHPAVVSGDLLIWYTAWDDSTTTTDAAEPTGPNGETLIEINATPITDASTETRAKAWYCVCTGTAAAGTRTFTPTATESWSATVVKVPAGEFEAATPIGATATSAATGTAETNVVSTAYSAGSTDGNGKLLWFAGVDTDPLSATNPTGWTILQSQDLGAVAHGVAARNTAVSDSESIASANWAIAGDSWTSIMVIVRAPTITNEVYINTSANISAGAADNTTDRLTTSGGTFQAGKRSDDTNGIATNLGSTYQTEHEWCLRAQSPGAAADYYEFRVYNGDTALTTYTVTPKWTIGTGGGGITLDASITQAADTISAAVTAAITLDASQTQAADTTTADASVAISLTASVAPAGDTITATAIVATALDASISQAGDTLSAAGAVGVALAASPTQAGDTITAAAAATVALDATPEQAGDTTSATAAVQVTLDASIAQAGDTISATIVTVDTVTLDANITQASDTATATGTVAVALDASATQAGDTVSATGAVSITASASVTQEGDTLTAAVSVGIAFDANITQAGDSAAVDAPVQVVAAPHTEARIINIATRAIVVKNNNAARIYPAHNSMRIEHG